MPGSSQQEEGKFTLHLLYFAIKATKTDFWAEL